MLKISARLGTIVVILLTLVVFTLSVGGCPKKNKKTKAGSSSVSTFMINAPSNLTATLVSLYQISLFWTDTSNNEDGFEVYRSVNNNENYVLLLTLAPDTASYSDNSTFDPFTIYYYRVRAFNTVGDKSAWSNEVNVLTYLNTVWTSVCAGTFHSTGIMTNGSIWTWGANNYGQLGFGDTARRQIPTRIGTDTGWSAVAAGDANTFALGADNSLWSWGYNGEGQLGFDNGFYDELSPISVSTDTDWANIVAGNRHAIARKTDGTLWAWGNNDYGQLGLGDIVSRTTPSLINSQTDWSKVGCVFHTVALKTNKTLWAWGWNYHGQLGLGDSRSGLTNRRTPTQLGSDSDWSDFAAGGGNSTEGSGYTIAIKTNGTLRAWGRNSYSQLGLGDTRDRNTPTQLGIASDWSRVFCGFTFTMAFKTNGTIWSWGANNSGQLGLGDTSNKPVPYLMSTETDWSMLSCGDSHALGLKTSGILYLWGANDQRQLGLGDSVNRTAPCTLGTPASPASLSAVVINNDSIYLTWVDRASSENGFIIERKASRNGAYAQIATVLNNITSWLDIGPFSPTTYYYLVRSYNNFGISSPSSEAYNAVSGSWLKICAGEHTVALKNNGQIWVWGKNNAGQLGLEDNLGRIVPVQLGTATDWSEISSGLEFTTGIKTNLSGGGTIWTWGADDFGQLGLGDVNISRNTPTHVGSASDWSKVTSGIHHNVCIKTNGTIYGWGRNDSGQLGLADIEHRNTPTAIGTESDWFSVASKWSSTIGLKTNNTLWSWGHNYYGQLGLGDTSDRNTPTQIGTLSDWSVIASGAFHTFAIKINNTLWSCGYNWNGQLGLGDSATGTNRNTPTQVGTTSDWIKVVGGIESTIGIKVNGTIWSWGSNSYGTLGLGDGVFRNTPTQIGTSSDWINNSAFYDALAIKTNGTLWGWGYNREGQLGLGYSGDYAHKNIPVLIGE